MKKEFHKMTFNFITLSLETHLFFARIMKEHALFIEAGFPCKNSAWIKKASLLREQFEKLLFDVAKISSNRIGCPILKSNELVTEFTLPAEKRTEFLSGITIDTDLTQIEQNLSCEPWKNDNRQLFRRVQQINLRSIQLLNELIRLKQNILSEVSSGRLFTFNYPLLIQHILREANLYRSTIDNLMNNRPLSREKLFGTEEFWNQIMMEHALFIRGLLDPSEEELVQMAQDFAMNYKSLLELAKSQDAAAQKLTGKSIEETIKYRDFKAAGTQGILNREVASIILPLLADHVLREANHYLRVLQCIRAEQG